MTCRACTAAEAEPNRDEFAPACTSCAARALAVTGAQLSSDAAGSLQSDYRCALTALFGNAWAHGHAQVKAWAVKLAQQQAREKVKERVQ